MAEILWPEINTAALSITGAVIGRALLARIRTCWLMVAGWAV
jgi:hypothetical protein